jgi:hypothetical protein
MEDDDGVRFDESLVEPPPQPEELAYTVRNDMFDLNDFTTVLNPAPYAHVGKGLPTTKGKQGYISNNPVNQRSNSIVSVIPHQVAIA